MVAHLQDTSQANGSTAHYPGIGGGMECIQMCIAIVETVHSVLSSQGQVGHTNLYSSPSRFSECSRLLELTSWNSQQQNVATGMQ